MTDNTFDKDSKPCPNDVCCLFLCSMNSSSNVSLATTSPNTPVTRAPTPAIPPNTRTSPITHTHALLYY